MSRRIYSREEKRNLYKKLCIVLACLVGFCVIIALVFKVADYQQRTKQEQLEAELGVVEINGTKYVPKGNIETYLFMGIDNSSTVSARTTYDDAAGQCDTLVLVVRDISAGTYRTLSINRNTITAVDSLDIDGNYIATTDIQICLAHANGDGMETSCENVVNAVSNLLMGQKIDGYAAVNVGAVATINNLIGGVTVTIEDDFSAMDSSLVMGETITLNDSQALHYVQGRMTVADGTNENRMKRQSTYMSLAKEKIIGLCQSNAKFPLTLYEAIGDYMVTNISSSKFCKLTLLMVEDNDEGELSIEGETGVDKNEWATFTPDEESLTEVIIELFYDIYE